MGTLTNKLFLLSYSLIFPLLPFSVPELQLEKHIAFERHASLVSPWLWQFVRFFLFWGPWQFWGLLVSCSVECPSAGICLKFFSWLGCGYGFSAGNLQKQCAIFITLYQKYVLSTEFITTDVDLHHPLMWYLSGLSIIKLLVFSPLHISVWALWKEVTVFSPYLQWVVTAHSPWWSIYVNYLEIPEWEFSFFSPICLSIYISMDPRIFSLCYFNPTQIVSSN